MKAKYIVTTLAVLTVGGISYAAYRYFSKEKKLLDEYEIKPIAFKIITADQDNVVVDFTMRFTNKSSIEATLKRLYSDIYLNEVFIGIVINDNAALIPAKGSGDIKLRVSFNPKVILKNIVDLLLISVALKDVAYRMKGYVELQSGFVPISVPFEDSGKLSDFL